MQDPAHIDLEADNGTNADSSGGRTPAAIPTRGHLIDLGDVAEAWRGQTVTIRPFLSYAADQRIESAATTTRARSTARNRRERRQGRADDTEVVVEAQPLDYAAAVIEECVLEWTITGADGRPLPATAAAARSDQAPAVLLNAVIDEIMDFYEAQRPDPTRRS